MADVEPALPPPPAPVAPAPQPAPLAVPAPEPALFAPAPMVEEEVMRPWKSARRCSACLYPNDSDASYCQACRISTRLQPAGTATVRVDEGAIQERFKEI